MASSTTPTPTRTVRRPARRILAAGAAGILLAGVPAGAALADPKPYPGQEITLSCDGHTYDVVTTRSGDWTPAFDSASNRVFQPVGLGNISYELTVLDGPNSGYTESGSDEATWMKGGQRTGQDIVACTFTSSFIGYDEAVGGTIDASWGGSIYVAIHG